jgi:large subunit ribosomal protein L21
MSVAVISLGGKQFTVEPGKIIDVPRLSDEVGSTLELTDMLGGLKVAATVLDRHLGDKIRVVKFKNKTRYTRTIGHRTRFTRVKIEKIEA